MKMTGNYKFKNSTPEDVWVVMIDPEHLAKALPGCDRLEEQEPGKYKAVLTFGIGAVKGTYEGSIEIADPEEPTQYTLKGGGSGKPGWVEGEALIKFSEEKGSTVVTYEGEMKVGGLVAGVGQRMIGGVAKMMLKLFFKKMGKQLSGAVAEQPA